jgi:cation diffusion facilitator family transporter
MAHPGRESAVRRTAWVGLGTNLALAALKLAGGIVGHSKAVVADAVHSISDMSTDVAILVGSKLWSRPSDGDHPYGHGRIETVVTVFIGLLLALVAVGIGYDAVASIHERHGGTPGAAALVAALVSIVTKEALYRWTVGIGRGIRSSAVLANAWHHRSDALSSIPTVLAVGVAMLAPAWQFIDHIGAIVVCLIILRAAYGIVRPAVGQLIDTSIPGSERDAMLRAVQECAGVARAHDLRSRHVGVGVALDLHVEVDPDLTVAEGHDIAVAVRRRLLVAFPDVVDVVVHIDPLGYHDAEDQLLNASVPSCTVGEGGEAKPQDREGGRDVEE